MVSTKTHKIIAVYEQNFLKMILTSLKFTKDNKVNMSSSDVLKDV